MVSFSLTQTECIGLIAIERYLFFSHPYLHQRLVTVKRVIILESMVFFLSFVYQLLAASLSDSYFSLSLLSCTILAAEWYFLPTMIIWIDTPAFITLLTVGKLTHMIIKKRRVIRDEQARNKAAVSSVSANVSKAEIPASTSNKGDEQLENGSRTDAFSEAIEYDKAAVPNKFCKRKLDPNGKDPDKCKGDLIDGLPPELRCGSKPSASVNTIAESPAESDGNNKISNTESSLPGKSLSKPKQPVKCNSQVQHANTKDNVVVNTMATAVKLIGCISLSYWVTYIPCLVVLHEMIGKTTLIEVELGQSPKWHFLLRYFFFFGLPLSNTINPVFHFHFNKRLKKDLFRLLRIDKAGSTDSQSRESEGETV